ncbi:MAG: type IV pilus assembly protein PilM [Myxococcales bacterium]|nr:MAG: type IV pilus assembly protein PilM [Myxococcales bacterium]
MAKSIIGLDIGSSSIKVISLKKSKRGYELLNFGIAPLPPQTIVDRALMNSGAVVDAIRRLIQSQMIKTKDCALSISGHSVIIKKISLPQMTKAELDNSIQWEAEQYIPFDINDVNVDVQILNPAGSEQGQMDVLLVAGKKDMVYDYVAVVSEAGLNPVVVDVDAFAVQNAFEINHSLPNNQTIALVNVGASVTNIVVISNGITSFTRDVTFGGNQFTEEIQKQLNLSHEEAEDLKLGGEPGVDADSVIPQEVERVIQEVSENLASEIRRSLEFFSATSQDGEIAKLYLCGGTAKISTLNKVLESRTGISVEVLDPFKNIRINESRFDVNFIRNVAPMAAVAVGLGLRRFDE